MPLKTAVKSLLHALVLCTHHCRLPYKPSSKFQYPPFNPAAARAASVPRPPVVAAAAAPAKAASASSPPASGPASPAAAATSYPAASASYLTASGTNSTTARKLHTVLGGADDRVLCKRLAWPFAPVAQLTVQDSSGELVCSGSLIGPDRLLTAAHCVWSTYERTFAGSLDAALGRYSGRNGASYSFVDPYGVVAWSHVTIFKVGGTSYIQVRGRHQVPLPDHGSLLGKSWQCTDVFGSMGCWASSVLGPQAQRLRNQQG